MPRTPWPLLLIALLVLAAAPNAARAEAAESRRPQPALGGAAITPDLARTVYEQLSAIKSDDGCALVRFDTKRSHIDIGLRSPSGTEHALLLGSGADGATTRRAGDWLLDVTPQLERDCPATLAAYESALADAASPRGSILQRNAWTAIHANYTILAATLLLLVAWTAWILVREAKARRPPPLGVAALVAISFVGLALRVQLSPHTFLHEYYHIAEALYANLEGETGPVYGDTGPAIFQLAAALLGRRGDPNVIFATNTVVAALAIPAIALLQLAVTGSWSHAICAAVLLCVLPQHLRFSASETLFVPAVTLAFWSAALAALYLDTRRTGDAVCSVLALAAAVQTRPEMSFYPLAIAALVPLTRPRAWRLLWSRSTLIAAAVLALLLVPRLLELRQVVEHGSSPAPALPDLNRISHALVFLQEQITPPSYPMIVAIGLVCGLLSYPGLTLWALAVAVGFTGFSLSLFDNGPYNLRTQVLPNAFLMLLGGGVAGPWVFAQRRFPRAALIVGVVILIGFAVATVRRATPFITALGDQQLEWEFLERTVPQLPHDGTLFSVVEVGGRNLDAFPEYLLRRAGKEYRTIDLRQALSGEAAWPAPDSGAIFYQGMFCYFAFPDEPPPHPITELCRAVHERYRLEPMFVADLDTYGYSALSYAESPYRVGFYRLASPVTR